MDEALHASDVEGLAYDPARLLRPGRTDAAAVLALAGARPLADLALWLVLIVLTLNGEPIQELAERLDSLEELVQVISTPFVWVLAALALRLVVAVVGTLAASPLSRRDSMVEVEYRTPLRAWQDRYFNTMAFADLRRSWAVRQVAADRLGDLGRLAFGSGVALRWLATTALIGFFVTATIRLS